MFASSFGDATICLRCQLRRTGLSPPRRNLVIRKFLRKPSERPSSPLRRRRRSERTPTNVEAAPAGNGKGTKILWPHGQIRGAPGHRVWQNSANIGIKRLGEEAEVILLRDAALGLEPENPQYARVEEVDAEQMSAEDLLASVDSDRGYVAPEDVRRTMHEIKATYPQKGLSWEQWLDARNKLCKAFSSLQLANYVVEETRNERAAKAQDRNPSLILQQSTWTPGITPFRKFRIQDFDSKRILLTATNLKRKEAFAERVLKDCWNHHVQADATDTGEIEILLRPEHLSLLVQENPGTLAKLAGRYDAKIDVSRHRSIIRFTADPSTCFHMCKDIESVLGNVRYVEFDLAPLQPLLRRRFGGRRSIDSDTKNWIAKVTGTEVQEDVKGQKLWIYFLGPNLIPGQDARRLLLSFIGSPNETPALLEHYSTSSALPAALCQIEPADSLSWINRQQQWSRWLGACSGLTRDIKSIRKRPLTGFEATEDGKSFVHRITKFLRREEHPMSEANIKHDASLWQERVQHQTYAVLGHVLHRSHVSTPVQISNVREHVQTSIPSDRTFSTNMPGILRVLNNLTPLFSTPRQAIRLRLTPSPWTSLGLNGVEAFPPIELRVEFDPFTDMPFVHTLEAVIEKRISDVMLPEEIADLRLVNRSTLAYAANQTDPRLAEFMANARLKVKGGPDSDNASMRRGRLGAPPTLKMRIPRRIIRPDSQVAKELSGDSGSDDVEMEYLYAGLDFREHLNYALDDYVLRYTMIEGGITGGRRGELVLHKAAPTSDTSSDDKHHQDAEVDLEIFGLFEKAYGLAQRLDRHGSRRMLAEGVWKEGPQSYTLVADGAPAAASAAAAAG